MFGVLTIDRARPDDASIAAMIDAGNLPPLGELVAMDDRGRSALGGSRPDSRPTGGGRPQSERYGQTTQART